MKGVAAVVALGLLLSLSGCGREPELGPTTSDLRKEREALAAKLKSKSRSAVQAASRVAAATSEETSGLSGIDFSFVYDAEGRRDPFRSIRWEREQERAQRAELGPLERFELEQLSVVAVIWDTNRPRALLSDPSGHSYIVQEGTVIGKNSGRVIHIGDDLVLVKETYVDFAGAQTTKDVELRIHGSEGG